MGRLTKADATPPGETPQSERPVTGVVPSRSVTPSIAAQYGRNRDPNYQQLNFNVPVGLRRRFKAKLEVEGQLMQDVLEGAIRAYVGDFLSEIPDYPSGRKDN